MITFEDVFPFFNYVFLFFVEDVLLFFRRTVFSFLRFCFAQCSLPDAFLWLEAVFGAKKKRIDVLKKPKNVLKSAQCSLYLKVLTVKVQCSH